MRRVVPRRNITLRLPQTLHSSLEEAAYKFQTNKSSFLESNVDVAIAWVVFRETHKTAIDEFRKQQLLIHEDKVFSALLQDWLRMRLKQQKGGRPHE